MHERTIRIAHSPDSDDAFMFWALATGRLQLPGYRIEHVLCDIETLNREALRGTYKISAISFHAYPYVSDRYLLMNCGASFGDRYGPILVARENLCPEDICTMKIAVPGEWTTACLALRLFEPKISYNIVPFDQILLKVKTGEYPAGLLIHEGQLTYAAEGLSKVLDLGEWWYCKTGLPLPLGGNVIRRDLEPNLRRQLDALLKESIQLGLTQKAESIPYARGFARGMNGAQTERFVSMYVNDWTLDYGEPGRTAVQLLLAEGFRQGILPFPTQLQFVR